tara:strand:+ start:9091 stop:9510 length:420 start_codon:yes stop_codon:yes gene_type:complete
MKKLSDLCKAFDTQYQAAKNFGIKQVQLTRWLDNNAHVDSKGDVYIKTKGRVELEQSIKSLRTDNVVITINDDEFNASVDYYFSAGESQIIAADPNDSREGCGDEYEIINLYIEDSAGKYHDVSYLIDTLCDDIVEQLN